MCAAFRLFTDNLIKVAHHILLGPSLFFPFGQVYTLEETGREGRREKNPKNNNPTKKQTRPKKPKPQPAPNIASFPRCKRQLGGIEQHTVSCGDNSLPGLTLRERGMTLQTASLYPQHQQRPAQPPSVFSEPWECAIPGIDLPSTGGEPCSRLFA